MSWPQHRYATRARRLSACGILAGSVMGCGGGHLVPRAQAPRLSTDEARCRAAALRETPLVTEWSAAEKASLQARLREGAVAVAYSGCDMRPILGCRLRGSYVWEQTTLSTDTIDIRNEDELFAKLPIGALRLEAELARSGHLRVSTTVSGQYRLAGSSVQDVPDYGECAQATHLLTGISVGSFKLQSGEQLHSGATLEAGEVGGGAQTSSSEAVLRQAGDFASCAASTQDEPHLGCSSPIQAFLEPLPRFSRERGEGTLQATFTSGDASLAWELRANQRFVCRTPCSRWINPSDAYELRTETGESTYTRLPVPDLRPYVGEANVEVVAHDRQKGALITGIALAGSGGGLMFLGGFLALAGSMGDERGLTVAGGITAGVGALTIGPGLYLILNSGSKTEIYSDRGQLAALEPGSPALSGYRQLGLRGEF